MTQVASRDPLIQELARRQCVLETKRAAHANKHRVWRTAVEATPLVAAVQAEDVEVGRQLRRTPMKMRKRVAALLRGEADKELWDHFRSLRLQGKIVSEDAIDPPPWMRVFRTGRAAGGACLNWTSIHSRPTSSS